MDTIRDGWGSLAEAIILQAVHDYRNTNSQLLQKPDDLILQNQKAKLETFFFSSWFAILTSLDGKSLLHRLQAETTEEADRK